MEYDKNEKIKNQIKDLNKTTMFEPIGPKIESSKGSVSTSVDLSSSGPQNYNVEDTRQEKQKSTFGPAGSTVLGDTSGESRPLSGAKGSPFYLDTEIRFPSVKPYKLQMPNLGLEFSVSSIDPKKAAWEAATTSAGVRKDYYDGYVWTGPEKDTIFDMLAKGTFTALLGIGEALPLAAYETGRIIDGTAYHLNKLMEQDHQTDPISQFLIGSYQKFKEDQRDVYEGINAYTDQVGLKALWNTVPAAVSSVGQYYGMTKLFNAPGMAASTLTNLGAAYNIAESSDAAGLSPFETAVRMTAGLGVISALDNISYNAMFGGAKSVTKRFARDGFKRFKSGMYKAPFSAAGEGVTESAQSIAEAAFSDAINADNWASVVDDALAEGLLGMAIGMSVSSADAVAEFKRVRDEKKLSVNVTNQVVKSWHQMKWGLVAPLVENGIMTEKEASDFLNQMTDQLPSVIQQNLQDMIYGQADKFNNADKSEFEAGVAKLKEGGGISAQQLNDLDLRVEQALNGIESFTKSDAQFIKGLFRGMANLLAYTGISPSQIVVPKFTAIETETEKGWYDPETHSFNINPKVNSHGTTLFDTEGLFKEGAKQNSLSPRHRTILHEFGHLLDTVVGVEGFGRFFEQYYSIIASQFGRATATQVKSKAAEAGGDRTSKRSAETSETDPSQTTEYYAQALSRAAAERAMKAVGLTGKVADFVAYANLVINGIQQVDVIAEGVSLYMSAVQQWAKRNSELLRALVSSQLEKDIELKDPEAVKAAKQIQAKLKRFLDGDMDAPLTGEEMSMVMDILTGFLNGEGVAIAQTMFDGVDTENLVTKGQRYLQEVFAQDEKAAEEYKQRKAQRDVAQQERIKKAQEAGADPNELPIFDQMPDQALPSRATGFAVDDSAYDIPEIISDEEIDAEQKNKQFDMRINTKIDGRTLLQDIQETAKHLDEYRPKAEKDTVGNKVYKWLYTKDMLTNVDEVLRVAGGEELAEKYGVVKSAQKATDRVFEYHMQLDKALHNIIAKGTKYNTEKWRFSRDKFLAECAERKIQAVRRDPVLTDREVPVSLNAFEAMTVYRMLKQTANQANVRINNVFLGKAQEIADKLTKEQKEYADAMGEIMGRGWEKYIEIALSEYEGRKYNTVDNYTPIYDAINNLFVGDLSQNSFSRTTQERDIEPVDMRMVFNVYMGRIANYEGGYYQKLRRLNDMVNFNPDTEFTGRMTEGELNTKREVEVESRKLRLRLESVLGKNGADVFVRGLRDSLEHHAHKDVPNSLVGAASRSIVTSLLAYNPLSLPKNATNISVFMGMGVPRYNERFMQGLSNAAQTWKTMMSIPGLKQRLGGEGIDEHLDSTNVGSDSLSGLFMGTKKYAEAAKAMPWLRPLMANMTAFSALVKRFGMKLFMQTGDAIANVYGAYPLYLHATQDLGMSHEEAGQYVMQAINERQSSSNKAIKTFGVRRYNRQGLGGLTAFSTEQVNKFRTMARDWALSDRGDLSRTQAKSDIVAILSTFVLFSLISAGAGDLFSDDDDVKAEAQNALLREALQSLLGAHPLGGSFAAPALMYMMGIGQPSGISVPASSYAMNMIRDIKKGDITDFMAGMAGVTGAFVGLDRVLNSWDGALDIVFGDTVEQVAAGYRRLWGRSESYAEKRTGYKEPVENEDEE